MYNLKEATNRNYPIPKKIDDVLSFFLSAIISSFRKRWWYQKKSSFKSYESCHAYEWVMSRTRMSHVTHTNESCLVDMYESCPTYEWVMSRRWMRRHDSYIWGTWLIRMRDMSHSYVRRDSYDSQDSLDKIVYVGHDSFMLKKITSQNLWPQINSN